MAYDGPFPLEEAYRVEIGVDFGGGPRRFTLFFIPPRTKIHDYPEMAAELCAGAAPRAIARGCTPVAGGNAVYFGADQPRITAEARIPWSALGISEPAAGTKLRVEIAVTAWDRDRWMSLSGRRSGGGDARSRRMADDAPRQQPADDRRLADPGPGARLMARLRRQFGRVAALLTR